MSGSRLEELYQIDPRYRKKAYKSKNVDILSFDGGGSRGIMEVSILRDVMRLATTIWRDPETLSYLLGDVDVSKNCQIRKQLIKELSAVSNPLHPNEIYDMIVGTSTGAFIAFGLVGGNSGPNGERLPMTLEECIQMYKDKTKEIFTKSWTHWFLSAVPGFGSIPITTYSQDNLKEVLVQQFNQSCLGDFRDSKIIAGAVARQLGQNEELVLFDTKTDAYKLYKTYEVLQATSDAPVYFETPVKIGNKEFVDGGVGGNCPLAQAIPRAREIFGKNAKITSALSIAPPRSEDSEIPNSLQAKYWLNYFVEMSTSGHAVYMDVKRSSKKNTSFQRLSPRGESLKRFKLDETDTEKMLEAMENEKLSNKMFLVDVIATAAVVVNTYLDKTTDPPKLPVVTMKIGANLAKMAGDLYKSELEYELAYSSYNISKKLLMKLANPNDDYKAAFIKIDAEIAALDVQLGRYPEAIESYRKNVGYWRKRSNDAKVAEASFKLGECLLLNSCHTDALEEFQNVLDLQRKLFGETMANPEVARTLNRLGWCHREQGNYDIAVKFYNASLDMRKQLYPEEDHPDNAETLNSLGLAFSELGKNDEALTYATRCLDMRIRLSSAPQNDILIAESLNNLGCCFMAIEDYGKAEEKLTEARVMKNLCYGIDHPSIAITLENYAKCLVHSGNSESALTYAQQALAMKKKCLDGDNNPSIAKTLQIVSLCFEKAGHLQKAIEYLEKALSMTEHTFGSTHPRLSRIMTCIGQLLRAQGKYDEAKSYFKKARDIEIWRDQDSESISSLGVLATKSDEQPAEKEVVNYENMMHISSSLSYELASGSKLRFMYQKKKTTNT